MIHTAAAAAKARIGQAIPKAEAPSFDVPPDMPDVPAFHYDFTPRPAVNFFADEPSYAQPAAAVHADDPAFASAIENPAPADALPDGAITFDDDFSSNVDDEGIPVWEDAP